MSDVVTVTLPDGKQLEFTTGATILDVAAEIGPGLAKAALAGRIDGALVDLPALRGRIVPPPKDDVILPAALVDLWRLVPMEDCWWSQTLGIEIHQHLVFSSSSASS